MTHRERSRSEASAVDRARLRVGRWLFTHGYPRWGIRIAPSDIR